MVMTKSDQDLLTQCGPGTPMGEVFRRYWLPAFLIERLPEPDCEPIAIKLLNEPLVAFRDSSGRVAIMEEGCPHRGVSLSYGRVEDGGIRCIYHGWQLNADGQVIECPAAKNPKEFGKNIRNRSYPTHEAGGIVWVYMGPEELKPDFPKWRFCEVPDSHIIPVHYLQECNYLQAVEGDIDAVHASWLHLDLEAFRTRHDREFSPVDFTAFFGFDQDPPGRTVDTDWGFDSVWWYDIEDSKRPGEVVTDTKVFLNHPFIAPAHSIVAGGGTLGPYIWHAWVPVDDTHHILYYVHYQVDEPMTDDLRAEVMNYFGHDKVYKDDNYKPHGTRENKHLLDYEFKKQTSFSGIHGIAAQDIAITQSQGFIVDRTKEHLGAEDVGVVRIRKTLMRAIEAVQAGGDPPRPKTGDDYKYVDGYALSVPADTDWHDCLREKRMDEIRATAIV